MDINLKKERESKLFEVLTRIKLRPGKPQSFYIKGLWDISNGRHAILELKKKKMVKIKKDGTHKVPILTKQGEQYEKSRYNNIN
jgi:hypothetical protein